jgi:hypothetical protein
MAYVCLFTGHSTRSFHGFLYYKANATMDIKVVAVYNSNSSLKRDVPILKKIKIAQYLLF